MAEHFTYRHKRQELLNCGLRAANAVQNPVSSLRKRKFVARKEEIIIIIN
jgi:hypothetical protein